MGRRWFGGTAFGRDVLSTRCRTRNTGRGGTVAKAAGLSAVGLAGMLTRNRHTGLTRGRSHRFTAMRCDHRLVVRRRRSGMHMGWPMVVRTARDDINSSSPVMVAAMVVMVATAAKTNAYRHQ